MEINYAFINYSGSSRNNMINHEIPAKFENYHNNYNDLCHVVIKMNPHKGIIFNGFWKNRKSID
jgi:hypothetical protein